MEKSCHGKQAGGFVDRPVKLSDSLMRLRSLLKHILILAVIVWCGSVRLSAQCSDAGVCSLSKHPAQSRASGFQSSISVGYTFGRSSSADDITYHAARLEGSFQLLEASRVSFLLPFNSQSGPLGSTSGLGDAIVIWRQTVLQREGATLHLELGGRFATGDANRNASLPQPYQSGLGTNDVLLGASADLGAFDVALAGQIPFGRSSNAISRLKRGSDVLVRCGYTPVAGTLTVHPSLLLIKRLGESSIADPTPLMSPSFIDVPGSEQTQINILIDASFRISEMYFFDAGIAVPLLKREINPDGLTRAITLSTGFSIRF